MASKPTNPRIDALVKPLIDDALAAAAATAQSKANAAAEEKAAAAVGAIFLGSGESLPTGKGAVKGQLFIKTGTTNPGLYMCTTGGESTSSWTAVAAAT